jgi:formamidopyrimidine-DNA glycosylase
LKVQEQHSSLSVSYIIFLLLSKVIMVEGPGATRNARKVQPCITSLVVELKAQSSPHLAPSNYVGETLQEAFCVGKEVFLLFSSNSAIRLHFGMNGSLCLSSSSSDFGNFVPYNRHTYYKKQAASLVVKLKRTDVQLGKDSIYSVECFGTLVSQVSTAVARSKRDRLQSLDVCASDTIFEPVAVRDALKKRADAMICDAVLDQNKFPGVGNIIKIEGLHRARVHPKRLVQSLSDQELLNIFRHCRQYALEWLKRGRAPPKRIYNETNCQSCDSVGDVRMGKLGNDLSRVTFWCERCQPLSNTPPSHEGGATVASLFSSKKRSLLHLTNHTSRDGRKALKQLKSETKAAPTPRYACPQHGTRSFCIRRVRHKEENRNRLFGTCKVSGCPYFAWVDTHFPTCPSCQKRAILRVSKTERSGGRWFFSCTAKFCKSNMFAWATPQQLEPLGAFLTPLL